MRAKPVVIVDGFRRDDVGADHHALVVTVAHARLDGTIRTAAPVLAALAELLADLLIVDFQRAVGDDGLRSGPSSG
jgi:hypothetical protein